MVYKGVGLVLTLTGLLLAWYFIPTITRPGFVIAAIALAMISGGPRYALKGGSKKQKREGESPT
ncbi:MAG: hypothetical protein ABL956_09675 [Hyphomonadaceae bacterium]